jgi:hypothetical protein
VLAAGGPDALLVRLRRVINHLLVEGEGLPPTLDAYDRETLYLHSRYLRTTVGTNAVEGDLDP